MNRIPKPFLGLLLRRLRNECSVHLKGSVYELQGACGGLGSLIVGSNDCSVSNRMYPMGVGAIVLGLIFGGISKSLTLNKEINESNSSKKLSMSELTGNLSEKEIFINFFEVVDNLLESIPDSEIGTKNMEAAEDIHRRIQEFMPNPSVKSKIDYFISIDRLFSSMPEEWIKLFSQSAEFDSYQKMGDWVRAQNMVSSRPGRIPIPIRMTQTQ